MGKNSEYMRILTVGHSNRSIEDFVTLLKAHDVKRLVDIRTVPRSRHNPQFGRDVLPASLDEACIRYSHMPSLGGLRRPNKDSINSAWQNDSFRGYADHMQTAEFAHAIDELIAGSAGEQTVIMCAESVPWRCHRSLVADALLARSIDVRHILSAAPAKPHSFTSFARVDGTSITYPGVV